MAAASSSNSKQLTTLDLIPKIKEHCWSCNQFEQKQIKKCGRCQKACYCSIDCQKQDWERHKLECNSKDERPLILGWKRYWPLYFYGFPRKIDDNNVGVFTSDHIPAGTVILQEAIQSVMQPGQFEKNSALWAFTGKKLPDLFHYLTKDKKPYMNDRAMTIDVIRKNSFLLELSDEQKFWLFCTAVTFFRHSCQPNCMVTFVTLSEERGKQFARIVALKPLAPGEELTIPYDDSTINGTFLKRRNRLKQIYHFDCTCPTCLKGPESEEALARQGIFDSYRMIQEMVQEQGLDFASPEVTRIIRMLYDEITPTIYPKEWEYNPSFIHILLLEVTIRHESGFFDPEKYDLLFKQVVTIQGEEGPIVRYLRSMDPRKAENLK